MLGAWKEPGRCTTKIACFCLLALLSPGSAPAEKNDEGAGPAFKNKKETFGNQEAVVGPSLTGQRVPEFESFDQVISGLMLAWNVAGGSVAVAKDGRILYARGFGIADEHGTAVMPDSMFRIASVSKIITAMAVLKLREEGTLRLDTPVLEIFKGKVSENEITDPRWKTVTVQNLLYHDSGVTRQQYWYEKQPEIPPEKLTPEEIVRCLLRKKLEFDPGSRAEYNNSNYLILGRIIEVVTGQAYEEHVRQNLLRPMGIRNMRIGSADKNQRHPHEVQHGLGQNLPLTEPAHLIQKEPVPASYSFSMQSIDASGGWVASAAEIVRFATFFDGYDSPPDLISQKSWLEMIRRPNFSYNARKPEPWQGMGWMVRHAGKGFNTWHNGSLPGTASQVVRTSEGFVWCWLFSGSADGNAVDPLVWLAKNMSPKLPSADLTAELFPPP